MIIIKLVIIIMIFDATNFNFFQSVKIWYISKNNPHFLLKACKRNYLDKYGKFYIDTNSINEV